MQTVLKTIAKQANLDRILFTPALKQIYFDLAVGSGGGGQFKHTESIRHGLTYAAEKAADKKNALLFCAAHELIHAADLMQRTAIDLKPVVILALRGLEPDWAREAGSFLQFGQSGWMQFFTHTNQEAYDHLALAYHLIADKESLLPAVVFHSALKHADSGEITPHENINLGSPLSGLGVSAKKKDDPFAAALAAVKNKTKEKPTLRGGFAALLPALRAAYETLGRALPPEGTPIAGDAGGEEWAAVTCSPVEGNPAGVLRMLCHRPFDALGIEAALRGKKTIAVIEPAAAPGVTVPPYYAEIASSLAPRLGARFLSIVTPHHESVIGADRFGEIQRAITAFHSGDEPDAYITLF
ncbi:MAG: hypothetical protein GC154_20055 [bacterium]|nr:hypothetical protein [bacterium]